jgi:hypothetical protein
MPDPIVYFDTDSCPRAIDSCPPSGRTESLYDYYRFLRIRGYRYPNKPIGNLNVCVRWKWTLVLTCTTMSSNAHSSGQPKAGQIACAGYGAKLTCGLDYRNGTNSLNETAMSVCDRLEAIISEAQKIRQGGFSELLRIGSGFPASEPAKQAETRGK